MGRGPGRRQGTAGQECRDHGHGHGREGSRGGDFFAGQIDLRAFLARHPHYPILGADPMVLEPERGCYAFLSRFGVLVAWNCPERLVILIFIETVSFLWKELLS